MKNFTKNSLYLILGILFIFWIAKQFGYPLNWYVLNGKYNLIHINKIETNTLKLNVPYWTWKIKDENDRTVNLEGISFDRTFLPVLLRKNVNKYSLKSIKNMCDTKHVIVKQQEEKMNIYCDEANKNLKKLEPFRIFWIKNKVFLLMPNYDKKYEKEYNRLIKSIKIK